MNRKPTLLTAALLAATSTAFAIEAEQFVVPTDSSLSREEVKGELRDLRAADALPENHEASTSPLEAREFDAKREMVTEQDAPLTSGIDRAAGDAVMARYAERFEARESDAALQAEEQSMAPDVESIFQHPAVTPAR